ncbi:MAG: AraC family transcriptional regulator [Oscillospiraceae bacterium]|jgi:AraC-like DNA-binding protein|nr:AraC family transcriptional regulator [Oscillospiraceae bacterium]
MNEPFSVFETFSASTGIGAAVLDVSGEVRFASSVYAELSGLQRLLAALDCAEADRAALIDGIFQSRRFGGRYVFITPSGLTYCVSPLIGDLDGTGLGAAAGPFLMISYDDYLAIDILERRNLPLEEIDTLNIRAIPFRTPVQARALCEMLALCAAHNVSGPFYVPYNEALAASTKHMDTIAKAIAYIRRNYAEKITLKDIASHVFFSPTYFSKVFREETGQTYGSFITAIRVEESKRLLRDPRVNLVDIPEIAGFESQSYFTRVFKKTEGCTPGFFRKRMLERDHHA